jgi:hypothetical protein
MSHHEQYGSGACSGAVATKEDHCSNHDGLIDLCTTMMDGSISALYEAVQATALIYRCRKQSISKRSIQLIKKCETTVVECTK